VSKSPPTEEPGSEAPGPVSDGPPRSMAEEPTEVAEVTDEGLVTTPLPTDPDADRFVGRVLANRYKVTRRLGTGGFGAVFAAEDTKIRKQVAVKVLTRDLVTDSAILTRFRKEAEAASKVGHENIVDITDFDRTADGHYFMVMEYLEGLDLGKVIRSGHQLPLARILSIMIQVCRGLHSAHQKGVVHRDLKPGNIFLTTRGSRADFVKLLDFGISKFMEVDDESSRLTRTGQIIGTPLYMAPEQACGEEDVDHRADVYSLGVIMYELVTGQPPFTAVNYLGIIAQHASDPPVPPSKVRPDLQIPKLVEVIILKAMGKRPQDRFSTMSQMEGALIEALATVDPTSAVSYSPDRTPPSLLVATTGLSQRRLRGTFGPVFWTVLVLTVVLGFGAFLYFRSGTPVPEKTPPKMVVTTPDARPQIAPPAKPDSAPPAPKMVVLRITSKPSGATVVDAKGAALGKTPLEHKLPVSDAELELTLKLRGYRNATLKLVPKADGKHSVTLKRQPRGSLPDDPKGWGQW
jgi:serine/threonine protein kinase